jgi:FkbH-like protein
MNSLYAELQWLPRAPEDFSKRLKALEEADDRWIGRELKGLASHALDLNQLTRVAKFVNRARTEGKSLNPLTPFRLAVLAGSTIDMMVPALTASAVRHGIALEIIQPSYDQVAQEALTPDSKVNQSKPDAVLIAIDYRALPLKLSLGDTETSNTTVQSAIAFLRSIQTGIKSNSGSLCIFQTLAPPPEALFGSLDRGLRGTLRSLIDEVNRELTEFVVGSGDVLLDVAALAETVGLADWHNPQLWNLAKLSFSDELIPLYADHVARTVAAIRGKSRKALILDLDNTVWGGVIGDDGLEGIQIAQGDARGEAHLAVQRLALDLRQRGIVLAVSSKNTDEIARIPFEKHPEMLLKLDHFAVFQANWNDKATNIQAIAEELSLGLDALVLLDDNPVERGLVRELLPDVAVPELPEEPAFYARTLAAAGYFEAVAFASEDLQRAEYYQTNAKRAKLLSQVDGVDAYLCSLDMTLAFRPFDNVAKARITQLINKSNQYNLTTRRYTEPEVTEAQNDPNVFTLQARLSDIFGDNGMISVAICRPGAAGEWEIDTWLMSCRVLGRKVEHAMLQQILEHARVAGITRLVGIYRPTDRNKLVADHYAKLGFVRMDEDASETSRWELVVKDAEPIVVPMKVVSEGFGVLTGEAYEVDAQQHVS